MPRRHTRGADVMESSRRGYAAADDGDVVDERHGSVVAWVDRFLVAPRTAPMQRFMGALSRQLISCDASRRGASARPISADGCERCGAPGGRLEWQSNGEGRAYSEAALYADRAAVPFHHCPDDEQAEATAFHAGAVAAALVLLEDRGELVARNAGTGVAHGDRELVTLDADAHLYTASGRRELDGIAHQVGERPLHIGRIRRYVWQVGLGDQVERHIAGRSERGVPGDTVLRQLREADLPAFELQRTSLDAAELDEVAHQIERAGSVVLDALQQQPRARAQLRLVGDHVGVVEDDVQRVADVVAEHRAAQVALVHQL